MRLLTGFAKPVVAVASNRDGSRLHATQTNHSGVWEWDISTGDVVRKIRSPKTSTIYLDVLAAVPDANLVVSAAMYGIAIWPFGGGDPVHVQTRDSGHNSPACIAARPGCATVAVGMARGVAPDPRRSWETETRQGYRLFDTTAGKVKATLDVTDSPVAALAFVGDGSRLVLLTHAGGLVMTEPDTGTPVATAEAGGRATLFAVNVVTGETALAFGKTVKVYRAATFEPGVTFAPHAGVVRAMAFSPDGRFFATAANDGVVVLRDGSTFEVVGRRHLDIGELSCVCWSGDSSRLFVGGNKVIAAMEPPDLVGVDRGRPKSLEPLSLSGHKKRVTTLAYSPDGGTLVSCDVGGGVGGWDLRGGAGQAKTLYAPNRPPFAGYRHAATWSSDGRRVALFGEAGHLFDGATGEPAGAFDFAGRWRAGLYFVAGGLLVCTGDVNEVRVELRDEDGGAVLRSSAIRRQISGTPLHAAAVAPDGNDIYFTASDDGLLRWNLVTGELSRMPRQETILVALAVAPDGRTLATAGGNTVYLWSLPSGEAVGKCKHPLPCSGVGFTPDGRLLTSCYDGEVRGWDVSSGAEVFALDLGMGKVYSLAVAPDGMTFAAGVHKRNAVVLMDVPE